MSARSLAALLLASPSMILAQPSSENLAVWAGVMGTPAGALTPVLVARPEAPPGTSIAGRFAGWRVGERQTNLIAGASLVRQRDSSAYSLTAGVQMPGCACPRTLMGGVEMTTNRRDRRLPGGFRGKVALRGSAGFGTNGDSHFVSFTTGFSAAVSGRLRGITATMFGIPELGWGDVSRSGPGAGGIAPIASGGLSLMAGEKLELIMAMTRVLVDSSVTNAGLALRWKLDA